MTRAAIGVQVQYCDSTDVRPKRFFFDGALRAKDQLAPDTNTSFVLDNIFPTHLPGTT